MCGAQARVPVDVREVYVQLIVCCWCARVCSCKPPPLRTGAECRARVPGGARGERRRSCLLHKGLQCGGPAASLEFRGGARAQGRTVPTASSPVVSSPAARRRAAPAARRSPAAPRRLPRVAPTPTPQHTGLQHRALPTPGRPVAGHRREGGRIWEPERRGPRRHPVESPVGLGLGQAPLPGARGHPAHAHGDETNCQRPVTDLCMLVGASSPGTF